MSNDQPIAYTAEGRPLFDNTPTVVCIIVQNAAGQILAVRRANEPGRGLLGLPGGYHMRGETWQQAGVRELAEETGVNVPPALVDLIDMNTDEYGNNLVIARYIDMTEQKPKAVDGEALEVIWVNPENMNRDDWAFPRHFNAVCHYHIHHSIHDE